MTTTTHRKAVERLEKQFEKPGLYDLIGLPRFAAMAWNRQPQTCFRCGEIPKHEHSEKPHWHFSGYAYIETSWKIIEHLNGACNDFHSYSTSMLPPLFKYDANGPIYMVTLNVPEIRANLEVRNLEGHLKNNINIAVSPADLLDIDWIENLATQHGFIQGSDDVQVLLCAHTYPIAHLSRKDLLNLSFKVANRRDREIVSDLTQDAMNICWKICDPELKDYLRFLVCVKAMNEDVFENEYTDCFAMAELWLNSGNKADSDIFGIVYAATHLRQMRREVLCEDFADFFEPNRAFGNSHPLACMAWDRNKSPKENILCFFSKRNRPTGIFLHSAFVDSKVKHLLQII